jgi:hypothetical protein
MKTIATVCIFFKLEKPKDHSGASKIKAEPTGKHGLNLCLKKKTESFTPVTVDGHFSYIVQITLAWCNTLTSRPHTYNLTYLLYHMLRSNK